jgi:hypothetical protein
MMNNTSAVIELPPIDHERDIKPVAVVVPDYNGDPIVHVFVTGERIARMEPQNDWRYEFTLCTTSAERQAYEALAYRLGELSEDADQRLAGVWGFPYEAIVFDEVTSYIDGHLMVAWLGTVADAVFKADPDHIDPPGLGGW